MLKFTKFFLILTLITLKLSAQNFDYNAQKYDWDKTPSTYKPIDDDKKFTTIIVFQKKYIEYTIDKSGNLEKNYLTHTLKLIIDDKSIEDNNKIYLPIEEEQALISLKSRVILNGKIISEASAKDMQTVEEEKRKYKLLAIKGLTKGAMVENIIALKVSSNLYDDEYLQYSSPVRFSEITLITPKHLKFNNKSYNGYSKMIDSTFEDRRFSYASMKNIPEIEEEKYSFKSANTMRIEYTYSQNMDTGKKYGKWPDLGRQYFEGVNKGYDKNEKELDKLLNKLKINSMSDENLKIAAIENFIKTNISVNKDADENFLVEDILKNKYAEMRSIIHFMIHAYRKAGINYEIVLTCQKDYKRFDPDFDSWSYLRDVILYFPNVGKFLDPSEFSERLGIINRNFLGQYGVFIKTIQLGDLYSGVSSVKLIPANKADKSQDYENYTVNFSSNLESADIIYKREMNNYADQNLRAIYFYVNDEKRKEIFEGFVKGLAKESKVTDLKVSNYNLNSYTEMQNPFQIDAKINTSYYNEKADDKILFKVGELIGQQEEMYQEKPRQNQADIEYAHGYNRTIKLNIPKGYKLKGLDKLNMKMVYNDSLGNKSFGFISDYKMEGNDLVISCVEYYDQLTYPKNQFDDFKKVINASADFNKITILIEKE